jgi:hypothetical protein
MPIAVELSLSPLEQAFDRGQINVKIQRFSSTRQSQRIIPLADPVTTIMSARE